jgi:hypothetical protein
MRTLAAFVTIAAVWVGAALSEYVCGRIILPEMGLTAPGYWPWFWFTGVVLAFSVPVRLVSEALK